MEKNLFKKILPHLLIILFFFVVSLVYFYPVLQGEEIPQHDLITAKANSHQSYEYWKKTGHRPCWAPQLFSGMPAFQVFASKKNDFVFKAIHKVVKALDNKSFSILFLYFLGFYLLLLAFKADKYLAAVGALAYGLASYNIIIIAAGHITKAFSLGYLPITVGGFYLIFREKKYLEGFILSVLSLGVAISLGHMQIIYYGAMLIGLYVLFEFVWALKEKTIKQFLLASLVSLGVIVFAALPNTVALWQAYEMSKYSIRGKSELAENQKQTGLDKDYALSWSYGIDETFSLIVPNIKGGATGYIGDDQKALDNVPYQYKQLIAQQNHYWGNQPFTSGPVYFGVIVLFLAVWGLFIVKNKIKWWLFTATVLSVMLSWGSNFPALTDFFFNHFPYYNKFRSPSMILVIVGITVPLLAILAVKEIFENKDKIAANLKPLWIAAGLTGGVALLFFLFPGIFNLLSVQEQQYFDQLRQNPQVASQINDFIVQLETARKAIVKADAIRSFFYVLLATGLIFAYLKDWFKEKNLFLGILAVLILADMWTIDRRYLNADNFEPERKVEQTFKPQLANQFILRDTTLNFRVVNIATNPFTDALTSYFHNNIGGYHGAKLRRYQDMIEHYLAFEVQYLQKALSDSLGDVSSALAQTQVLNMLNTRYIIFNPAAYPLPNPFAFGNAWFVDNIKFVNSPKEEINALQNSNLRRTAIVDKSKFPDYKFPQLSVLNSFDTVKIKLVYFSPDTLKYVYNSPKDGFVVFSEVYYPEGWKAYIDGKEAQVVRANYILRAMSVPAGKHTVTMIFKPKCCYTGATIALISSIVLTILILAALGWLVYKRKE